MECVQVDQKWISWIREILVTTKMSILVNGAPTEEFSPVKGLRQGDPIAPYLFLLIGEVLSKLIVKAQEKDIFEGIIFDFHPLHVTHVQYADDTILFLKNDAHSIRGIKKVLLLFQVISGLSINFNKSIIYHPFDESLTEEGINIFNCKSSTLPFKYLGDWVGLEKNPCSKWSSLVETVRNKLQRWKCSNINMAGRMILIRSCLDSLPIYGFSLHKIPKTIIKKLDLIRRNFLWGGTNDGVSNKRKLHSLSWKRVCTGKCNGVWALKELRSGMRFYCLNGGGDFMQKRIKNGCSFF